MPNVRVRIRNGEHEIEIEGDKSYVAQMLKEHGFNKSSKTPDKPIEDKPKFSAGTIGKTQSPAEFVLQHQFKKHTDIALAFAYYLEKINGLPNFTPADINNCYYEAKLEASNTSQMIIQNMRKGFLMESKGVAKKKRGGGKNYTITQSGIKHVEKFTITK